MRLSNERKPSPKSKAKEQIDLHKKWNFITPCITTKEEIEKLFGNPISKYKGVTPTVYETRNEQIGVYYGKGSEN